MRQTTCTCSKLKGTDQQARLIPETASASDRKYQRQQVPETASPQGSGARCGLVLTLSFVLSYFLSAGLAVHLSVYLFVLFVISCPIH